MCLSLQCLRVSQLDKNARRIGESEKRERREKREEREERDSCETIVKEWRERERGEKRLP